MKEPLQEKPLTVGQVKALVAAWESAKLALEREAANELKLRKQLIERYGSKVEDAEGAHKSEDDNFVVTVTHKLNRKLDEEGLGELVKKYPELAPAVPLEYKLALKEYRAIADTAAGRALARRITVKPGLATVEVKPKL